MARKPNRIKTVQVTLSTTQSVTAYLDALVLTGLHGKNRAEAAEQLLVWAINRLVAEGALNGHGQRERRGAVSPLARR